MDDASSLADTSQNFSIFLTIARKFKHNCLLHILRYTSEKIDLEINLISNK